MGPSCGPWGRAVTPALCRWEAEPQRGGSHLSLRPALADSPALDSQRSSAKFAAAGCLHQWAPAVGGLPAPGARLCRWGLCVCRVEPASLEPLPLLGPSLLSLCSAHAWGFITPGPRSQGRDAQAPCRCSPLGPGPGLLRWACGPSHSHVFGTVWRLGSSMNQESAGAWQGLAHFGSCDADPGGPAHSVPGASCPNPCRPVLSSSGGPCIVKGPRGPVGSPLSQLRVLPGGFLLGEWETCLSPSRLFLSLRTSGPRCSRVAPFPVRVQVHAPPFLPQWVKAPVVGGSLNHLHGASGRPAGRHLKCRRPCPEPYI